MALRLKNWLFLFGTTLFIGAVISLALGTFLESGEIEYATFGDWLLGATFKVAWGLLFSAVSQMGFFAYLTINYFALSFFKAKWVWQTAQVIIISVVFYDFVLYRDFLIPSEQGAEPASALVLPGYLLGYAVFIAIWKSMLTNKNAFVPTIFFMFVFTLVEALPTLAENDPFWTQIILSILIVCNTWQVLWLHRLVSKKARPEKV